MTTPQQPELRRSGRGEVDPRSAKAKVDLVNDADDAPGPVPPANQPGHRPKHDQDKPTVGDRDQSA
jgi:hypothetical protein